jgi:hypothetical protein
MIYKVIIGLLLIATVLYYIFCFLEIFGVVKFTDKNTTVKVPQMFIPFYYLIHNDKPVKTPKKRKVKPIIKKEN